MQDHEPTISSTTSFPICEPIFISPTSYRKSPMGPPPFTSFPQKFLPSLGHSFHTGAPVSVFCTSFPTFISLFLVQTPFTFQSFAFVFTVGNLLSFFYHTQPMSPLVGALLLIYPHRHRLYLQNTTQVTYLYPLNLFTLSRLWHNLSSDLVVPLTLDLVTWLWPRLLSCTLQPREVWSFPTF
jgi:hypothetical protein